MARVGVVGAGVMGVGVAESLATAGHEVLLLDVDDEILKRSAEQIRRNLRMSRLLGSGAKGTNPEQVMDSISYDTDYELLGDADFVIENVTEKWETKKEVYPRLDAICPPHCILASNTSAIPITRIASLTDRWPNVLGIHFMNPAPLKPVVELILGHHTSQATIGTAQELLATMGKSAIVVNDSPGFVSNRVLMPMINEAAYLVFEHVATAEDVDSVFKSCLGHKMGPLETADLIGLDTILHSIDVLYERFSDSKYRPCPLLRTMVDAGLYGRKSGRGFYSYD